MDKQFTNVLDGADVEIESVHLPFGKTIRKDITPSEIEDVITLEGLVVSGEIMPVFIPKEDGKFMGKIWDEMTIQYESGRTLKVRVFSVDEYDDGTNVLVEVLEESNE